MSITESGITESGNTNCGKCYNGNGYNGVWYNLDILIWNQLERETGISYNGIRYNKEMESGITKVYKGNQVYQGSGSIRAARVGALGRHRQER